MAGHSSDILPDILNFYTNVLLHIVNRTVKELLNINIAVAEIIKKLNSITK